MQEIEDELHGLHGELKSFPIDAHWFCPKRSDDDPVDYENPDEPEEDITQETKRELIQEAARRHDAAYKFSLIFGLDTREAPPMLQIMLEEYTRKLELLLTSCDKCVRNYHMGRKPYLKMLAENFDDDTIAQLSERISVQDFARIDKGLAIAERILHDVEPQKRTQSLLVGQDSTALLALYESLCCVDYHMSEEKLSGSFNFVFTEVQRKRPLKLSDLLPAMVRFLFDDEPVRVKFALQGWERRVESVSKPLFDWVVYDALTSAIRKVSQPNTPVEHAARFWKGVLQILAKLDGDGIRHSLKAMEIQPNLYMLALQHLTYSSPEVLCLIIEALKILIAKSAKDFWEAFGTISPATIAEQIFVSSAFHTILMAEGHVSGGVNNLSIALSWIPDFIQSLPAVHQFDACRGLLHNLIERLQSSQFPPHSRMLCCRAGLSALSLTLATFNDPAYEINASTSLVVISNILGLVQINIRTIISCADLDDDQSDQIELKSLAMKVVSDTLALDSKAISSEFTILNKNEEIQRGDGSHSQAIWQAVLEIFRPGNTQLAKSILEATSALIGLDELLPSSKRAKLSKDQSAFNQDLQQLHENVSRVYERLSDFQPSDLHGLYYDPKTALPLFASLISASPLIYEAGVEIIKTMTGQSGRRDAMTSMSEQALVPMLKSLNYAFMIITKTRTFGPVPNMLKTSQDLLEALSCPTGVLRTIMSKEERLAVMSWWSRQWKTLDMIFMETEPWVTRVDKSTKYMEAFCRDAMDYAEALFDAYSIVATAVRDPSPAADNPMSGPDGSKLSRQTILLVVCRYVNGLTKMLRLRDKYLVSVITSLLSKLLRCLGEYDVEIGDVALAYIKDICKREHEPGFKKTNLSNQQKAELQRALEEHQGIEMIEALPKQVRKQATIDAWSKSADGKVHEPAITLKRDSERHRSVLEQMKSRQQQQTKPTSDFLKSSRQKAAEEKKLRDAAAIAKAKALRGPSSLVPGEGSGLKDIGVLGKDHTPIRSEIMVGSSDEDSEDSEDEDEDETNALVKKSRAASKMVSEYEESRRRALKAQQGPVRKTKIQRSAKDLRARVEPNMDRLYLEILNWDLFHKGDTPPSTNEYRKIAQRFLDLDLYKRTFFPLLISEVWKSLVAAKEENRSKPTEIKIHNRLSVDKFLEVSSSMPLSANKDLKLAERDIVLFSQGQDPMNEPDAPHCLARVDRRNMKKDVLEVTYRISRDCNPKLLQSLGPNGKIRIVKIADMTTTQREYAALSSLEYYDLCNEVLEAKPSPLQKYSDDKITKMSSMYKLNRGQARAILSANDNDGFTLIQGPPGSGKTKTIVALIGALLTPGLQTQSSEQYKAKPLAAATASAASTALKKKLLICAPSNAAVDELVLRLKEGIQPLSGPRQKINVIRIGRSDAINASVKDVMLDELVAAKLEGNRNENKGIMNAREKLHQEAGQIKQKLAALSSQIDEARTKSDKTLELKLQRDRDVLIRNRAHVNAKIDEDKTSGNTVSRENEINRRKFQQEIIDGAHVLCATLSGSGHDMFRNLNVEFESVIIDEAAQCIELSALIPLKYGCSKCILVGDPEQLPPTVLSRSAQSFGYEQSLFVRMQLNHPKDVHLLDTQYRMHPEISRFPSQQFYHSRLLDGEGMAKLRQQPWHVSKILGPYRFFDVKGIQTKEARGHSFINVPELNAAIRLYERLKADYRSHDFRGKIGIIATYKAQLNELQSRFIHKFGDGILEEIEFNTTDAFQGREREIIIFSCVRATASGGIGFLADIRRMNVGLTRAKSSLWVLGDSRSLQQGEFWNKLIEDSKARDRYTGGDVMSLLSRPTSRQEVIVPEHPLMPPQKSSPVSESFPGPKAETSPSPPRAESPNTAPNKMEEEDIVMLEASSRSSSRKSSNGENSATLPEIKSHGKRARESSEEAEALPAKKTHIPSKLSDAGSTGSNAPPVSTTTATRQPPPPGTKPPQGMMVSRKKAPADPFIRRKPPGRK